jgi:hypothetical protein
MFTNLWPKGRAIGIKMDSRRIPAGAKFAKSERLK